MVNILTNFDIPRYRSHKEVWAAEIEMISIGPKTVITFIDCKPLSYINEEYEKMIIRYKPVRGDFLVIYPDGYQSFSPRQAFLDGYSKV